MYALTISEKTKEAMNLKEGWKRYMGGFDGKKGRNVVIKL